MLVAYKYVPHQMERMHRFINFIFYQIWCRAPKTRDFDLNLFDVNPALKEVMTSLAYDDTQAGDRFYIQVQGIYKSFSVLPRRDIAQFKRWYQGNNDLEKLCANSPAVHLARYADIAVTYSDLSEQLAEFFKGLYSHALLNLAALRAKIGEINDHYQDFATTNRLDKCPFCGLSDLLGEYHTKREAYDHYLPKALYPFNSINFKNLVPACHHCNSSYKTSKDVAYTPKDPAGQGVRRKVFYPFSKIPRTINVSVALKTQDIERLQPTDVELIFGPIHVQAEIDTWRDVYGIDERYKAKCCSNDAKDWLEQVRILRDSHGVSPAALLINFQKQTEAAPVANSNFLKTAFLEGCQNAGLLDVLGVTTPAAATDPGAGASAGTTQ